MGSSSVSRIYPKDACGMSRSLMADAQKLWALCRLEAKMPIGAKAWISQQEISVAVRSGALATCATWVMHAPSERRSVRIASASRRIEPEVAILRTMSTPDCENHAHACCVMKFHDALCVTVFMTWHHSMDASS